VIRSVHTLIPGASFGYIGNLAPWGDDRLWMVFLPHPGRVGGPNDSIGQFRTGDLAGAERCLTALHAYIEAHGFDCACGPHDDDFTLPA
jgi:hypothetical protein